ncbi:MAG: F0F1 ATP synthase subunit B [bacterium]|nr:F0F1 ATP synthase subunit B [bacterium]
MADLFSNLGIDVKLLVAQAVNFLLVLWLLNRFVFKRILGFLEKRKQGIEKGVELTHKAEREMERIGEVRHRELEKARGLAEGILEKAKVKGNDMEQEFAAKARGEAEVLLQKAHMEGERKKQDVLREAEAELRDRAFQLAEKVLSRSLTKKDEALLREDLFNEVRRHG